MKRRHQMETESPQIVRIPFHINHADEGTNGMIRIVICGSNQTSSIHYSEVRTLSDYAWKKVAYTFESTKQFKVPLHDTHVSYDFLIFVVVHGSSIMWE
jgi:hypothetical protein